MPMMPDHFLDFYMGAAIEPGAVNWMKAGLGIVHSGRTAVDRKRTGQRLFGIQT